MDSLVFHSQPLLHTTVLVEDTCPHLYAVVEIHKLALVALASRVARSCFDLTGPHRSPIRSLDLADFFCLGIVSGALFPQCK